jgi:putative flippase GtrA
VTAGVPGNRTRAQGLRFLTAGALNTLFTYALYCLLVVFVHPQIAYAVVFAIGIGVAYLLNSCFVFATRMRIGTATVYPLVYAAQYAANALLIDALTRSGLGPRSALAIALVLVTPLSFVLNRMVLTRTTSKGGR